ncbi:interferon-induced GTP-binding protein Mx [Xylaria sp. FL0064]|nr:interferon-induced GTP-binding protein Mx [Xylaria sp. FL0064]
MLWYGAAFRSRDISYLLRLPKLMTALVKMHPASRSIDSRERAAASGPRVDSSENNALSPLIPVVCKTSAHHKQNSRRGKPQGAQYADRRVASTYADWSTVSGLFTDEQRLVLDTIAQVRKCGLESILSLSQLVVCGDQSAGKSSISFRRGLSDILTIRIIPDEARPPKEKQSIKAFVESITDSDNLPRVMDLAMVAMGIANKDGPDMLAPMRAFARDTLSIEIEGPSRPQLTLVDIPGLIHTSTKGVSDTDVALVAEITEHYISQPRTICLVVISAANDVNPQGDRTLGIITRSNTPSSPPCSGSANTFLKLARNENMFFKLEEAKFFRTSNFKSLPKECVGIDALRTRLSVLLFEYVKHELPKLRQDLEEALREAHEERDLLGAPQCSSEECRSYLAQLSLDYYELCKAAFSKSNTAVIRLRAVIQQLNTDFAKTFRLRGPKFQVDLSDQSSTQRTPTQPGDDGQIKLSKEEALDWVRKVLVRTRGKELVGNFNPLLVGELFWEQSSGWKQLAVDHIEEVSRVCEKFLGILLDAKAPKEVRSSLFSSKISDALKGRRQAAHRELDLIWKDSRAFPINYNHYYTDTIFKRRQERQKASLAQALESGTEHHRLPGCQSDHTSAEVDIEKVITNFTERIDPDMENFSCEDALDCLFAIYKELQKTFVANITTQVIERHIVRGLEDIFSPLVVNSMLNVEVEAIASEPLPTRSLRDFLNDRIKKLKDGQETFRVIMGNTTKCEW